MRVTLLSSRSIPRITLAVIGPLGFVISLLALACTWKILSGITVMKMSYVSTERAGPD